MFVHALSGAASFAACLRLFRSYPLAVSPCYSAGWHRSIVLRHRAPEGTGFYVLTQDPAERFTLRPWNPADGECQDIRPGTPVPVISHRVITEGMPVPRDGAMLGWVSDRQATVLLSVYHGQPAAPGPVVNGPVVNGPVVNGPVPQVRVLAMVGSEPMRWPPFTACPLDDGRLWEYVERCEIVDLAPVIVREAGGAFWVPSQHLGRAGQGHGCVVVSRNLQSEDYWVPAGTYMDHWMLREGVPSPSASHLLALPGATDLSRRLTAW
ncbi:MAG TPA: hypothetical protein VH021_24615 [Trebonia sp.]|nr:hypothetical protein [Trebonia sp.]